MITNFNTNKIYLAKGICRAPFFNGANILVDVLRRENMCWEYLPDTDSVFHIWVRDYMPIQINKDKLVMFRYEPDYLKNAPEYMPNVMNIITKLCIEVIKSDIVMDGGNIISCGNRAIMTDKVFLENPHYTRNELIDRLTELLESEPVFIPWDIYEEFGHADGMIRYMGEGRVLMNNYCDFDQSLRKKLLSTITPCFDVTELHYGAYTKYSWAYLNFLHVGQLILIPSMEDRLQDKAIRQISDAYPECRCIPIPHYESIVKEGGALNCTTWNILQK